MGQKMSSPESGRIRCEHLEEDAIQVKMGFIKLWYIGRQLNRSSLSKASNIVDMKACK